MQEKGRTNIRKYKLRNEMGRKESVIEKGKGGGGRLQNSERGTKEKKKKKQKTI